MNTSVGRSPRGALSTMSRPHTVVAPIARKASRCGSRRRRPITSPPGGGITARPKRASSGPASRKDARICSASSGAISTSCTSAAHSASVGPAPGHAHTDRHKDREQRLDIADAWHIAHNHLILGEEGGGEDRQRAVLVTRRDQGPRQRNAAFDDELLHRLNAPSPAPEGSVGRAPGKRNSHLGRSSRAERRDLLENRARSPGARVRSADVSPEVDSSCNSHCKPEAYFWLAEAILEAATQRVRMFGPLPSEPLPTLRTYVLFCPPSSARRPRDHCRFTHARGRRGGPPGSRMGGALPTVEQTPFGPGGLRCRRGGGGSARLEDHNRQLARRDRLVVLVAAVELHEARP